MATINGTERLVAEPGNQVRGPYIDLPVDYAPAVLRALKEQGIRSWLEGVSVSVDGGPFMGTINVSRNNNAAEVQAVLDGIGALTPGGSP